MGGGEQAGRRRRHRRARRVCLSVRLSLSLSACSLGQARAHGVPGRPGACGSRAESAADPLAWIARPKGLCAGVEKGEEKRAPLSFSSPRSAPRASPPAAPPASSAAPIGGEGSTGRAGQERCRRPRRDEREERRARHEEGKALRRGSSLFCHARAHAKREEQRTAPPARPPWPRTGAPPAR